MQSQIRFIPNCDRLIDALVCGKIVEKVGRQGLSCKKSADQTSIRSEINKISSHALSSAGFPNILELELPGMSRDDEKQPDRMTLIHWSCGKATLRNATV